ncbi:hypothetical protein T06_11515 [Trichinella sp. T6]|nr:hypothetical protein T06_11515 [Trichinella sp. T6]
MTVLSNMDVAFDASHNDSLVFVFLPHDVHAVHSSLTGIILHSGATYIKALRNCSSVSTAGVVTSISNDQSLFYSINSVYPA